MLDTCSLHCTFTWLRESALKMYFNEGGSMG